MQWHGSACLMYSSIVAVPGPSVYPICQCDQPGLIGNLTEALFDLPILQMCLLDDSGELPEGDRGYSMLRSTLMDLVYDKAIVRIEEGDIYNMRYCGLCRKRWRRRL